MKEDLSGVGIIQPKNIPPVKNVAIAQLKSNDDDQNDNQNNDWDSGGVSLTTLKDGGVKVTDYNMPSSPSQDAKKPHTANGDAKDAPYNRASYERQISDLIYMNAYYGMPFMASQADDIEKYISSSKDWKRVPYRHRYKFFATDWGRVFATFSLISGLVVGMSYFLPFIFSGVGGFAGLFLGYLAFLSIYNVVQYVIDGMFPTITLAFLRIKNRSLYVSRKKDKNRDYSYNFVSLIIALLITSLLFAGIFTLLASAIPANPGFLLIWAVTTAAIGVSMLIDGISIDSTLFEALFALIGIGIVSAIIAAPIAGLVFALPLLASFIGGFAGVLVCGVIVGGIIALTDIMTNLIQRRILMDNIDEKIGGQKRSETVSLTDREVDIINRINQDLDDYEVKSSAESDFSEPEYVEIALRGRGGALNLHGLVNRRRDYDLNDRQNIIKTPNKSKDMEKNEAKGNTDGRDENNQSKDVAQNSRPHPFLKGNFANDNGAESKLGSNFSNNKNDKYSAFFADLEGSKYAQDAPQSYKVY